MAAMNVAAISVHETCPTGQGRAMKRAGKRYAFPALFVLRSHAGERAWGALVRGL